ncbi:hypothetical protein EDB80DRAFT_731045 [Ilyonectria destructans]|nr:hypothetical protein EDB80DRAFT_731045 [Ilyonectria destructans]
MPSNYLVLFSTAPMSSDIEITGHATLRLAISVDPLPSSDASPTEIDVFATLRHIDASG